MKVKLKIDDKKVRQKLKEIRLTESDMRSIEDPGGGVVVERQVKKVPLRTGETMRSINQHITEASSTKVVDEIGPEVPWAPYLEYGTGEYAEGGQGRKGGWVYYADGRFWFTYGMRPRPFVRPSVLRPTPVFEAVEGQFLKILRRRWQT